MQHSFQFTNTTDKEIQLDLSHCVLVSASDGFSAKDVTGMGRHPLTTPLALIAKSDSLIGFGFREAKTKFAGTYK
jgi:hypothetical protein